MPNLRVLLQLLLLTYFFLQSHQVQGASGIDDDNPYRHIKILDPEGRYKLEWLVNWEEERIYFNVTVETRGFVTFGISRRDPNNINFNIADLIVGGIDWKGRSYFTDRYSKGSEESSLLDAKQDWILHEASESESHSFLSFSRAFDTCDSHDIPINDDSVNMLWAYGEQDLANPTSSDYVANGSVPMFLLDPDLTPRAIQEGRLTDPATQLAESDIKVWSLRTSFKIPPKRTTYWCTVHKSTLSRKHHIIGFTVTVNNESISNVHHTVIYRCIAPNPSVLFEKYLDHPGEECYAQDKPLGEIPIQSCVEAIGGFSYRGYSVFFPETMGVPIGTMGQAEYFIWQIHYDNPTLRSDIVVETQFDSYYTARLRPNDGGLINIGHHWPGSPSILLPPRTTDHKIVAHCSPTCTRKMFPENGIKIVAGILHSHGAARRVAVQHFRNDIELPLIFNDDNFHNIYQPTRLLRREVTILPGDQITTRCYFDTTHSNQTTVGSYGTDAEMCVTFAYYYGQLTHHIGLCRSEIISPEYTARYLAGARNLTWDQSRLEFVATNPRHLAGMTVSEISDSPYVKWTPEQRARLKRDQIVLPQSDICPSIQEYELQLNTGITPPPTYVTYPISDSNYSLRSRCSL